MKKVLLIIMVILSFVIVFSAKYTIDLTFLPDEAAVWGNMTVELENGEKPQFILYPNLDSKDNPYLNALFESNSKTKMEILTVTDEKNEPLDYTIGDYNSKYLRKYQLKNSVLLVKTDKRKIHIKFKTYFVKMNGADNVAYQDIFIWRFGWYPMILPENGGYVLKAHNIKVRFNSINNKDYIPVFSGKYIDGYYVSEGKFRSFPIVFVKKNVYNELKLKARDYEISIWYKKGQEQRAAVMATHVIKALEIHTENYGKLKYSHINVVQDPYPGMYGMAADGMFLLGDGFFTTADLLLPGLTEPLTFYVVSHELAHLWFGIGVGVDFFDNNFMSEAFADYSAHISMFEKYDNDPLMNFYLPDFLTESLVKNMPKTFSEMDQKSIFYLEYFDIENAVSDNIDEIPYNFASSIYYIKGKRALFSLEELLTRKKFTELLAKYYKQYNEKDPSEEEFYEFLIKNGVKKEIVYDLFESKENFDPSIKYQDNHFVIDLDNKHVPVRVQVITKEATIDFVTTDSTVLKYDISNIKRIDIDPDMHTFDVNRRNNHYPVIIKSNLIPENSNYSDYDSYSINFETDYEPINILESKSTAYLAFEAYPYYSLGVGYFSLMKKPKDFYSWFDKKLIYEGIYFIGKYNPSPWLSLSSDFSFDYINKFQEFNVDLLFALPQKLDIGLPSKILTGNKAFYGGLKLFDLENYYVYTGFEVSELFNSGLYTNGSYYFMNEDNEYNYGIIGNAAYFFDNYSKFFNSFSIEVAYSNAEMFNALNGREVIFDEEFPNTFTFEFSKVKYYYGLDVELFHQTFYAENRLNVYNLFSLGNVNISLNALYKYTDEKNLLGTSIVLSPKLYFLTDSMIPLNLELAGFYSPELNKYNLTLSLTTTLNVAIRNLIQ
ncbi:hypothetical protein XO10_02785 [Marinitoga sp. 1135]|uniref:M1 family aminopeptidase n=1 Tax=unclassified Marinitoga TaxID=2640159 RepID=UPI0015869E4A|nr:MULTISPECIES: M1 family aminopeptidase [unclassified Marinitoga]NUU95214.1 hypothetical protein [Marinitoga sp. 1135]NUU97147.1 hypothetical protein [Marinitoga sp. 1138]